MKKIYLDIVREIRKSIGRFLSILAIVAIGVAFYAGIKASGPLMKETADQYFDEYNLQDIQIYSTLGFVDEDIDEIRKIEGVEGVHATHSMDAVFTLDGSEYVYKVMTIPKTLSGKDYINQAILVEGRMPENENECVVEEGKITFGGPKVGDVIELDSGTDTPIEDTLKQSTVKVVGKVRSPYFLSYQKGSSSVGDGSLDGFLLVYDDNFKSEIYTEVYVTVEGADAYNSYQDAYFDEKISPVMKRLSQLEIQRASLRTDEVKEMALKEVEKGEKEFKSKKENAEAQLKAAEKKLQKGYEELVYGENKVKDMESTIKIIKEQGNSQIEAARGQLALLKAQLASGESSAQVDELKKMLEDVNTQIEAIPEEDRVLTNEEYFKLVARQQSLELLIEIASSEATREQLVKAIEIQEKNIDDMEKQLVEQISSYEKQIQDGKAQLVSGRNEYEKWKDELEKQKKIMEEELLLAEEKLTKARNDVENMNEGEWIILDRHSHYSYMDYGGAADRMENIAKIFPVFFFLVAALICLTTMTRMVDEQRGVIGTLKALGYSKKMIALRYLCYAFISSVVGCVIGVLIGFAVFPTLIVHLWNMMYTVPDATFTFYWDLALIASVSCTGVILLTTWFAVNKELKETPALLMRPKAPGNGKRIFLEKIDFIWKRLSFTRKVTFRNLFRYKKRFFMTIIGISGCTALLVAGYGINDSIRGIVSNQYDELQKYDISIKLSDDLNVVEREDVIEKINSFDHIDKTILVGQESGSANIKNKDQSVSLIVVEDVLAYEDFHTLRTRNGHHKVELPTSGVLISEKMANDLGVKKGNTIRVNSNDSNVEFTVEGIFENYVGHLIIMGSDTYKSTFGLSPKLSQIYARTDDNSSEIESALGKQLNQLDGVESIVFHTGSAEQFNDMISSLSIIIVVLVVSAGLLAFVVLYNLTNVNISERIREIATLKVLGFYDKEVSSYVFRENLILSMIGALFGLLLGTVLHRLIMSLAELDNVMFGRIISWKSYLISFVITMLFAWIVARFMHFKLKKIPMVESLKSVE